VKAETVVAAPERLATSARHLPVAGATAAVVVLVGAELLFVDGNVLAGLVVDAVLVLALANLAAVGEARLFGVLALVPLARLLSFTMPLGHVSPLYWHALVGAPLLPALALAARAYGFSLASLGLRRGGLVAQLAIAASGVPLGIAAYVILRPPHVASRLDWSHVLFGSLTLLVFAAFVEELLFRGLLQRAAIDTFGAVGAVFVNVVFAVTAIGSLSAGYALFVGLEGGWFSFAAGRSRCLWGVIAAHALAAVGLVLVWPVVLG
jgi:membrane protease YdiL (CAAX protease family)